MVVALIFMPKAFFLREVLSASFIVSPNPNAICEPPVLHVLPGVSVMKGKFCMWWRESFVCSSFSLLRLIHSAIASRPGRGKWGCCFIRSLIFDFGQVITFLVISRASTANAIAYVGKKGSLTLAGLNRTHFWWDYMVLCQRSMQIALHVEALFQTPSNWQVGAGAADKH